MTRNFGLTFGRTPQSFTDLVGVRLYSLVFLVLIISACRQTSFSSGSQTEARTVEISGTVTEDEPVEFTPAGEPVAIVGVNLTGQPELKVLAYASDHISDELLGSATVTENSFSFSIQVPAGKYIKLVVSRSEVPKYAALLPVIFDDSLNVIKARVDRATTLATKIFEVITRNARSGSEVAKKAVSENNLAVHNLLKMGSSIDRHLLEQKRRELVLDNVYLNLIAGMAARESNRLLEIAADSSGQPNRKVQEQLSQSAYETLFGDLSKIAPPSVLAHRVDDGYNSFDVTHTALIEAWRVSPSPMYPVVSAFQIESIMYRSAATIEAAVAASSNVSSQFSEKFPSCAPGSPSQETNCIDLNFKVPTVSR